MGTKLTVWAFVVLFGGLLYLGAVVAQQQRTLEALVSDHAVSLELQSKLSSELRKLRQRMEREP